MAFFVSEEDVWQCIKHPSKRRRTGICPTCLRQRLATLCTECASILPCSCTYPFPPDSMATSSSSFSLFQFPAIGDQSGPVPSNLIGHEPAIRKSRSMAIPILRSRSKYDPDVLEVDKKGLSKVSRSKVNLWSVFKMSKTKKCDLQDDESNKSDVSGATEDFSRMMRSRSMAVDAGGSFCPETAKRRGWYLPSPMKAFRQSKTSKLQTHEMSPMHRG